MTTKKTELAVITFFDNGIFRSKTIQHSDAEYTKKVVDEMVREHGFDILEVMRYDTETLEPITDVLTDDKMEQNIVTEIASLHGENEELEGIIRLNEIRINELEGVLKEIKKYR